MLRASQRVTASLLPFTCVFKCKIWAKQECLENLELNYNWLSLIDVIEQKDKGIRANMSALAVYFVSQEGREWRAQKGGDDKAAKMMGCRCPSPTSDDEQLRPRAADKQSCGEQDLRCILSSVLQIALINTTAATEGS